MKLRHWLGILAINCIGIVLVLLVVNSWRGEEGKGWTVDGRAVLGAVLMAGNVDFNTYLATNIGNAATDFDAAGGLRLAGILTTTAISDAGNLSVAGLTTLARTTATAFTSTAGITVTGGASYISPSLDLRSPANHLDILTMKEPDYAAWVFSGQYGGLRISGGSDALEIGHSTLGTKLFGPLDVNGKSIANAAATCNGAVCINDAQGVVVTATNSITATGSIVGASLTATGDIAAAGGRTTNYQWRQLNVPVGVEANLYRVGSSNISATLAPSPGSILMLSVQVYTSTDYTNMLAYITPTKTVGGVLTALGPSVVITNAGNIATAAKDTWAFASGDLVGLQITVASGIPKELYVDLTVEY